MLRRLVLIYGLLGATLYCALLPLWEGFDELFHYGYVQTLANDHAIPVIGETRVSMELWKSLDYAPMSPYIQDHLGRSSINFGEYFRFPEQERRDRRRLLETINPALAAQPSSVVNYEAKQAPLTYMLLAPVDLIVGRMPLPSRIFSMRLALALTSMMLAWSGMLRLGHRLGMTEIMTCAATFVLFSCQMTYGTVCHVANDALLGPWLLFFLRVLQRQKNRLQTKLDTEQIMAATLPLLSVRILELAKEHGRVTTRSVEQATGENRSTIKARLKQLTDDRLLIRYGNGRSTWYGLN